MRIEDDFRDLAPLAPRLDPERWARMTAAVEAAAAPELARRTRLPAPGPLTTLVGWMRPALSAAAITALLAAVLMSGGAETGGDATVGDALGYPDEVTAWVEAGYTPSVEELLVAMEAR